MPRCLTQRFGPPALAIAALATLLVGQEDARWLGRISAAGMHLVGPSRQFVPQRQTAPITTPPGDFAVHFPPDAAGKPESLVLVVPAGADIAVAVEPAGLAERVALAVTGDQNYLVAAWMAVLDSVGQVGLLARRTDDDNWYRFVWDGERSQFRLERSIGGAVTVIRAAPGPATDNVVHSLALQVEGFRLRAFFDHALVLQALDGAHLDGHWQTWQSTGLRTQWIETVVERPAEPRASSARIATAAGATFVAATGASAGHHYVVEFALDRPHPLVPLTANAVELWLLQRPAAPSILIGDFRGELGGDTIGELQVDGRIRSQLRWPNGGALLGQCALVRAAVISPNGERLVSRTPSVPLQFRRREL